jgi:hypothetical protein
MPKPSMTLAEMDMVPRKRHEVKLSKEDLPRLRAILASSGKGKARGQNAKDLDFVFERCMALVPGETNRYLRDRDREKREQRHDEEAGRQEPQRPDPVADWDNRIQVLAAVKRNGFNLQHASEALRDTKEIVMAAVTDEGGALRYASPGLRDDKAVVMQAIESDPYAYYHASAVLRADKHIALRAGVPSPWRDALRTKVDLDMRARVGLLG